MSTLHHYRAPIVLLLLSQLLGGCQTRTSNDGTANSGTSGAVTRFNAPLLAEPVASLGLTCDKCLWMDKSDCAHVDDSPIIAIVADLEIARTEEICMPPEPAPHFASICEVWQLYRFGQIEYLRNTPGARARDTFEGLASYDFVESSEIEKYPARGPLLRPGKRYVIFARTDRTDIGLVADRSIHVACELAVHD
jgi:hypothetical protein